MNFKNYHSQTCILTSSASTRTTSVFRTKPASATIYTTKREDR